MKVWRFYYAQKREDNGEMDYQLYAITNKKEYAKEFKKTRNMNKFIVNDSKLDFDDWKEFANQNRGAVLDIMAFNTKCEMKNGFYGLKPVMVLCTLDEYQTCSEEDVQICIFEEEFFRDIPNYKIFDKRLLHALETIQYTYTYDMFTSWGHPVDDGEEPTAPELRIDEFSVFVNTYGETLSD